MERFKRLVAAKTKTRAKALVLRWHIITLYTLIRKHIALLIEEYAAMLWLKKRGVRLPTTQEIVEHNLACDKERAMEKKRKKAELEQKVIQ